MNGHKKIPEAQWNFFCPIFVRKALLGSKYTIKYLNVNDIIFKKNDPNMFDRIKKNPASIFLEIPECKKKKKISRDQILSSPETLSSQRQKKLSELISE